MRGQKLDLLSLYRCERHSVQAHGRWSLFNGRRSLTEFIMHNHKAKEYKSLSI